MVFCPSARNISQPRRVLLIQTNQGKCLPLASRGLRGGVPELPIAMMQLHQSAGGLRSYGWNPIEGNEEFELRRFPRRRPPVTAEGRHIEVRGTVQGVGFRPWIWRLARETGVNGRVSNDTRGVTIEAFGTGSALDTFLEEMRTSAPPAAEIRHLSWSEIPPEQTGEFVIVASRASNGLEVSIPPDLATCADCLEEIRDPLDRRYRYPFTNCTNCGPRFTIVARRAVRPAGDDHGDVPDVRRCRARVRRRRRPPVPRSTQCVPGMRPTAAGSSPRRRADLRTDDPIDAAAGAARGGRSSPSRASADSTSPVTPRRRMRSRACGGANGARRSPSR